MSVPYKAVSYKIKSVYDYSSMCQLFTINNSNINNIRNNSKLCPLASSKMDATSNVEIMTEMEEDSMKSSESDMEEEEVSGEIKELKRCVSY